MIGILAGLMLAGAAPAATCVPEQLAATTVTSWPAADADQGAAADEGHFYAIDNAVIAKHDRLTGALINRWSGEGAGQVRHINSCFHEGGRLYCANSNYPQVPMGSSVEIFDAQTLASLSSHSFGMMDEGSLTWFDRVQGGWLAGFTHYGKPGGLPYKDNRYSSVVAFDAQWQRMGGWLYPEQILERMAPYGASGGSIGPDGYLYVSGHDLPEVYVLAKPKMGPLLVHIATIAVEAHGQAFSWDDSGKRHIFAVNRDILAVDRDKANQVLEIVMPPVPPACHASMISRFER